jgi:hypothetical protein
LQVAEFQYFTAHPEQLTHSLDGASAGGSGACVASGAVRRLCRAPTAREG